MSRTNPYKKKRRSAKTTLLVYGEGLSEEMFLKHLRGLYAYNSNAAITIKKGKGGTADAVVVDADKTIGAFDRKVVVLDNDKEAAEMEKARQEASERGIELIENSPCLEALLLSILMTSGSPRGKNSAACKRMFEENYMEKKKRTEPAEYQKVFPKALLEERRKQVQELQALIFLMEGN